MDEKQMLQREVESLRAKVERLESDKRGLWLTSVGLILVIILLFGK